MTEKEFYNKITNSKKDLLREFLYVLEKNRIAYCVIGGVAINAYCAPLVTLDFDCVVIMEQIQRLKDQLKKKNFRVKSHPYTWEITHKASDIKIQIQRDQKYQGFIQKAVSCRVLGYEMPVASKEDLLRGKLWAYQDPTRDELKREKDILDIKRLLRNFPELENLLDKKTKRRLKA